MVKIITDEIREYKLQESKLKHEIDIAFKLNPYLGKIALICKESKNPERELIELLREVYGLGMADEQNLSDYLDDNAHDYMIENCPENVRND